MLGIDAAALQQQAEDGDADAQVELGKMKLAQERFEQAAVWFKRAADQDHREAQCLYGSMLSEGLGIDQDAEAAAYWLLRAAQQGHSGAQLLLAESFESGNGVPVNRTAAKTWYQKAAEQGDHVAQYRYGQLLLQGTDDEKKDAVNWLRLAAEGGCSDAQSQLVEILMTSAAPNRDELLKWASSAADSGASKAHYLLGSVIENFFDVTRIDEAVAAYRKAAEQGFTDAQIRLGKLYAEGKIVAQDQKEAERWLAMVVADGQTPASREMTDSSKLSTLAPFMSINEYPPGSIIDNKYFIMSVLGRGGMCMVYKAKHLLMNKMVALKMLLPESAADAGLVERFKREAQAASSLNHPNVITIYDLGVSPDGKPFMVMDYLEGQSLEERIQASGPIPVEQLIPIFVQVCAALEVAHEVGIIHRDIKPSNIMLINTKAQADHVKVVDFGLAKLMTDESSQKLTKSGEVFGTLMYMSPEQCLGHPLDVRTDIYSVGCTMYEAATAQPPFRAPTPFELMNKHVNHAAPPLSETAPEIKVSGQLEAIVLKTLAKNREERFQSVTELREALSGLEKQPKKGWFK